MMNQQRLFAKVTTQLGQLVSANARRFDGDNLAQIMAYLTALYRRWRMSKVKGHAYGVAFSVILMGIDSRTKGAVPNSIKGRSAKT
jgi:hypothetical protein